MSAGYWYIIRPEYNKNLITNPSFETNTTGWSTSGTNSIFVDSGQQLWGLYSCLITYGNNLQLLTYGTGSNFISCKSAWIYVPDTWSGGNIILDTGGINPNVVTSKQWTSGTDPFNAWFEIWYVTDGATSAGSFRIRASSAPGVGDVIYVDGCIDVEVPYRVTYLDGDQPDGIWLGTPHAAQSERPALSANGGRIMDFNDDLDFPITKATGSGYPPVNNLSSPLALKPGSVHDGQSINERTFTLHGSIVSEAGEDAEDFHTKKQTLVRALNALPLKINHKTQPRILRYTGASVDKEIRAVYDSGLENGLPLGWTEVDIPLKFKADDPLFKQIGWKAKILDSETSATARLIMARIDYQWSVLGPPGAGGTYTQVLALAEGSDGKIYIGGSFLNWDGIANADYIVSYDPVAGTYAALGTGMNGVVRDLKFDANGILYAGGAFTTSGGVTTRGIASWNGSAWSAVGPPSSGGTVSTIEIVNGDIYIGGTFLDWDGIANADRLAMWNGSAWSALGTGANNDVNVIRKNLDQTKLFMGGTFTSVNGVSSNYIIQYTISTTTFAVLNDTLSNSVNDMAFAQDGSLYVGGEFSNYARVYNGQSFTALGSGLNNAPSALAIDTEGSVWFGGVFTTAGGLAVADKFARWNGSRWVHTGVDLPLTPNVWAILITKQGDLYVGFDTTDTAKFGTSTIISYTGTYRAYPKIEIEADTGMGDDPTLQYIANATTGAELFFNYIFEVGEKLTIDFTPGNESITSSFRGRIFSEFLDGSDFGQFYLTPGNGSTQDNVIVCFAPTASADFAPVVYWQDTYISED